MLMQNFKSATDLGITDPQKEALMKTLVLLETGKLQHAREFTYADDMNIRPKFTGHFNMGEWGDIPHNCGTVACIGGTAELIAGRALFHGGGHGIDGALYNLFYPDAVNDWAAITTEQAAHALRSYLTTGDARWDLAVS